MLPHPNPSPKEKGLKTKKYIYLPVTVLSPDSYRDGENLGEVNEKQFYIQLALFKVCDR
jgi:hypothetical protein